MSEQLLDKYVYLEEKKRKKLKDDYAFNFIDISNLILYNICLN